MATSQGEHNVHFDTEHLKTELRMRSARGGAVTLVGQTTKAVLQLTGIAFLARLLSPGDFGLIAMVAALTGFLIMFQDMGLSMATIQRSEINHAQVSTLFWVNVAVSVMLMVATTALSSAVAWFYKDPRLTRISIALGIGEV